MKWTYLLLDAGVICFPLLFSFEKKVRFFREWKFLLPGMFLVSLLFLGWDSWFTASGRWSFHPAYLCGLWIGNLPLEEWLFFGCVPFAAMFVYLNVKKFSPLPFQGAGRIGGWVMAAATALMALTHSHQAYTWITCAGLSITLLALNVFIKPVWLGYFFFTWLILLLPMGLMNGLLTGLPVVRYNPLSFSGWKVGSIPLEDFLYFQLLLLLHVGCFELTKSQTLQKIKGMLWGALLVLAWAGLLGFLLVYPVLQLSAWVWVPLLLVQTHLFTGLFITAHDAMHGSLHARRGWNTFFGWLCGGLFAFNYYPRLYRNHHAHHQWVASSRDPDFHRGNFPAWYFSFLKNYITPAQLLLMALAFNLLIRWFDKSQVLIFWVVPALLSTLQLFFFGTWWPHHGSHSPGNRHHARSQPKNHVLAFLSCYFFGYHYEHHESPQVPWWELYKKRS